MSAASTTGRLPADSRALGLLGNAKIIWVFQNLSDDAGSNLVRFAYRPAGDAVKDRYWRGPVVTGQVALAAPDGEDIHVFFADGTHWRFSPIRFGVASAPSPTARELNLPDNMLPLLLATDEKQSLLYAVVPSRVAEKIENDNARRIELDQALESDEDDVPVKSPQTEDTGKPAAGSPKAGGLTLHNASGVSTDLTVVRYERGRWLVDRPCPSDLHVDDRLTALLADGAQIYIATLDQADSVLTVYSSTRPNEPFQRFGTMQSLGKLSHVTFAVCGDNPCLAAAEVVDGGDEVLVARWSGTGWSAPTRLVYETGKTVRFAAPNAVGLAGTSVAVATVDESNTPQIGLWSTATGQPVEAPVSVSVIAQAPTSAVNTDARQFLQYAILAAVLVAVFVWRRERVIMFAPLHTDQQLARLERRALAFVVDLAILAPIWVPIVFAMWRRGAPDLTVAEQLTHPQPTPPGPVFWAGAVVGANFGLYAGILELLMGQTLGKRVVRCEVVGEGGDPCPVWGIFVRNAIRVVEFQFPPLALLVALTPSRQRLGDMLARSVVIERTGGPPKNPARNGNGDGHAPPGRPDDPSSQH